MPGERPSLEQVRVTDSPSRQVVALDTCGPYWKLSEPLARLKTWMRVEGLAAAGDLVGVFHDDPETTEPEECRFSLCYPVTDDTADAARAALARRGGRGDTLLPPDAITVRRIDGGKAATLEYHGPAAASPEAYAVLDVWIDAAGLRPAGAPREVYIAEPGTLEKGVMHVVVQRPLASWG